MLSTVFHCFSLHYILCSYDHISNRFQRIREIMSNDCTRGSQNPISSPIQIPKPVDPNPASLLISNSDQSSSSSRRHGRFLVQPLMDASLSGTPCSARACSPATKVSVNPSKVQSSPTLCTVNISERRPSRIIGRFEVCELFDEQKAGTGSTNSPQLKPIDAVHIELSNISETCATTPVKDQEAAGG